MPIGRKKTHEKISWPSYSIHIVNFSCSKVYNNNKKLHKERKEKKTLGIKFAEKNCPSLNCINPLTLLKFSVCIQLSHYSDTIKTGRREKQINSLILNFCGISKIGRNIIITKYLIIIFFFKTARNAPVSGKTWITF